MPRKVELSIEVIEAATKAAEEAKNTDELRMAQTVLIPNLTDASDSLIAKILGRSRATVVRLRKQFRELCSGKKSGDRNWGGRRYGYMSIDEEHQFLSKYLDEASHGGVLVVSEIKQAFEAQVGHKVAKTTIYRMLERHGWRKIMPRPHHPKSDTEAREGFKKTPENRE